MAQILEFRRDNTLRVVELAARNRSSEQLERARALLKREESEGSDPKCALEIDIEMNALLGEASGNLLYQFVTNLFTKLIRRLGPLYFNEQRHAGRSWETHRQLLEALERGDAAEARSIVGVMLGYSEAAILREIEQLQAGGLIGPDAERGEP
jgi:DNA-binding FadR family transcriptional regulator